MTKSLFLYLQLDSHQILLVKIKRDDNTLPHGKRPINDIEENTVLVTGLYFRGVQTQFCGCVRPILYVIKVLITSRIPKVAADWSPFCV